MVEPNPAPKEPFTAREVGALVESLHHDIRLIAEGVVDIRKEVDGLKGWRANVTDDLTMLKTGLRTIQANMKSFDERLRAVEAKVGL